MEFNNIKARRIVENALNEDIGFGDITTKATIPQALRAKAVIRANAEGLIAGMSIIKMVYKLLDDQVEVNVLCGDGQQVTAGATLAEVTGPAQTILTGERVALNFVQRLSGIATKTRRLVDIIKYYNCHLTDTRMTTPGLRIFEKYAVHIGGGRSHRFNLSDGILINGNHIKIVGGLKNAVIAARQYAGHTVKIEVETNDLAQVQEALDVGVDIIMLNNMSLAMMMEAVSLVNSQVLLEASGNISEENILDVAKTGVNYISTGSITHSYQSIDISMDINYK